MNTMNNIIQTVFGRLTSVEDAIKIVTSTLGILLQKQKMKDMHGKKILRITGAEVILPSLEEMNLYVSDSEINSNVSIKPI